MNRKRDRPHSRCGWSEGEKNPWSVPWTVSRRVVCVATTHSVVICKMQARCADEDWQTDYEVRNSVTDVETVMKPVNLLISSNFYTGVQFVPLREHNSCPDQTFIAAWGNNNCLLCELHATRDVLATLVQEHTVAIGFQMVSPVVSICNTSSKISLYSS